MKYTVVYKERLSDLTTPVALYLKLRAYYPKILLLESSDYSSKEDSQSFICFDSLERITIDNGSVNKYNHHDRSTSSSELKDAIAAIEKFTNEIDVEQNPYHHYSGVFGFTSFDAIQYFDTYELREKAGYQMPDIRYDFYRYVIVFDHFFNKMVIIEHNLDGQASELAQIESILDKQDVQTYEFQVSGERDQNMADETFMKTVTACKAHCQQGNLFQIVPSRRYQYNFSGDEFNLYRALRSINPSPYLFYFDYGSYKIFGSSPEAQLRVEEGEAEIHPIAGTFKRTGNFIEDQKLAEELLADPKENAEHTMLVDLARNDLSKGCDQVVVSKFKEVQFFSHVIHLVSIVKGKIKSGISSYRIFADTFPAGTLSGAPKYRALEIIDQYEPTKRGYYGGGLGMIGLNGNLNHAIMIRSFLSYEGALYAQAGAGIVIDSVAEKELHEVNNKLEALNKAITEAENI